MTGRIEQSSRIGLLAIVCALLGPSLAAAELAPVSITGPGGAAIGTWSARTVSAAVTVDRDGATLAAFTLKDRPFRRSLDLPEARAGAARGGTVQLEVALLGPGAERVTQRLEIAGLCLDHPAGDAPHITGDRVRIHRDTLIVELPELEGFDRVEVARYEAGAGFAARVPLGSFPLAPDRFTPAGGSHSWSELAFAPDATAAAPAALTPGTVHWPEEYGDTVPYLIYGKDDVSKRINIVIVPDGYTYAQKTTMLSHAQSLVNYFRSKTPFKEHDPFVNYILVFAYSTESGTDQCDCSIVKDTAMNTRFPLITASCQNSDNRCLYYGSGNGGPNCDPNVSETNIAAAELRAPARDTTLVMVNTTRYGGCGGYRAVYSAGNSSATEVAVHELGHSLANLADEYSYDTGCGWYAGEINTSVDSVNGAWPEWISTIGPPAQGAEYYQQCLYRPQAYCDMRSLSQPFCAVCNQQWALTFFSHPHVAPTAPIESASPPSPVAAQAGAPVAFSLGTRLGISGATNGFDWILTGPGYPVPTNVYTAGPAYTRSFTLPGTYDLSATVTADTNFIKPDRYGPNVDSVYWSVHVQPVPEVSSTAVNGLRVSKGVAGVTIRFEDVGSTHYNLYVSNRPPTAPFAVTDPQAGKRSCALAGVVPVGGGMLEVSGYDPDAGITGPTNILFFLVTADNGAQTEGSLGKSSALIERTADSYCAR